MANKTANLYARIEPDVKEEAEQILQTLGISVSSAINIYYKQIILQHGIPFDVKIPQSTVTDISALSDEQLEKELQKGYDDSLAGRTRPAERVFADIRRDYGA